MVIADTRSSTQSRPAAVVRDDNVASNHCRCKPIAIDDDEIERMKKIIADYESTRKGMFMFLYNGLISK